MSKTENNTESSTEGSTKEKAHTLQTLKLNKIGTAMLYLSVTLEILLVIIDKSDYINPIEGQLFRITFLLAVVKIFLTKYSLREWLAIILFGCLGMISYKATGRNEILRIAVFIAACKSADMKKMLKYVFFTTLAGCLFLVLLSVTGIYGNLVLETDFGRGYVQRRYCLGLGHPNALHCMFMMLVLLGLYLYNSCIKWYHFLLLLAANQGLYFLTDSNTGWLMTLAVILAAGVMHYIKGLNKTKWTYMAGALALLTCVVFSLLIADIRFVRAENYVFHNPLVAEFDNHLNGRVRSLYYDSANSEGTTATWSLFSRPENEYYFDLGFVRLFYWYGIIPGIVYTALNFLLIWQCYRKKDGMGMVMTAALAVYTVVEAHIISVYIGRNYILFLFGMYGSDILSGCNKEKEEYLWSSFGLLGKAEQK